MSNYVPTRDDNKIVAFCNALKRSEQLVTASCMTDDDVDRWRWMSWASAIAGEWCMSEDLRQTIAESARENVRMGRAACVEE